MKMQSRGVWRSCPTSSRDLAGRGCWAWPRCLPDALRTSFDAMPVHIDHDVLAGQHGIGGQRIDGLGPGQDLCGDRGTDLRAEPTVRLQPCGGLRSQGALHRHVCGARRTGGVEAQALRWPRGRARFQGGRHGARCRALPARLAQREVARDRRVVLLGALGQPALELGCERMGAGAAPPATTHCCSPMGTATGWSAGPLPAAQLGWSCGPTDKEVREERKPRKRGRGQELGTFETTTRWLRLKQYLVQLC